MASTEFSHVSHMSNEIKPFTLDEIIWNGLGEHSGNEAH